MTKRDVKKFIKDNQELINDFPNNGVQVLNKLIDGIAGYEEAEWIGLAAILLLLNNDKRNCKLTYYQLTGVFRISYMDLIVPFERLSWYTKIPKGISDPERVRKESMEIFLSDDPITNRLAKNLIYNIYLIINNC